MDVKIRTWAEFEAASEEERRAIARKWIEEMQQNYAEQCRRDDEADARAIARGYADPSETVYSHQSSTSRTEKL